MWRYLLPGLKLKRYLVLVALGWMGLGAALTLEGRLRMSAGLLGAVSLLTVAGAGFGLWRSLQEVVGWGHWPSVVYARRYLLRGPRVVALGGGTGMPAVLRGLKEYTANLTAIVTVADDGGSSGRLKDDLGMLPPGDLRNCMVALADTESLMAELFQYRFESGELAGHSFGNLFLAAMEKATGDFVTGLRESSRVLAVRGRVLPATLDRVELRARLVDGRVLEGESQVGQAPARIERVWLEPEDATPLAEAIEALEEADLIVLGPGSLYTSVIPNLLIHPIAEAIRRSRALRVLVANAMTQPGETSGYSVFDHVRAVEEHAGGPVVDVVLVNRAPIPPAVEARYRQEGAEPVSWGQDGSFPRRPALIAADLIQVEADGVVRHDPAKLARTLLRVFVRFRPHWAEGHRLDAWLLEGRLRGHPERPGLSRWLRTW